MSHPGLGCLVLHLCIVEDDLLSCLVLFVRCKTALEYGREECDTCVMWISPVTDMCCWVEH